MSSQSIIPGEKDVIERLYRTSHLGTCPLIKETTKSESERPATALSRLTSRLSTRDIVDPGPPPDGGLKAWTQVAMGVSFATFNMWRLTLDPG